MDLRAETLRLVLDDLAVQVSAALAEAGIPHVVLKGPTSSLWLYDPPRGYRDVDLLLPVSTVDRAVGVLGRAGLARPGAGRVGEEAPHSLLLKTPRGVELDLHVTLPTLPPTRDDRVWRALVGHVLPLDIGVGVVPALDEPARCLVVALHALNSGPGSGQPVEDLTRARDRAGAQAWAGASRLAAELDAGDLLVGALAMLDGDPVPRRARLYVDGAPSAAFGLERLLRAPRRQLPRLLWRELVPTVGFMQYDGVAGEGRLALLRAYARRWRRLVRDLPDAVRAVRRARR